MTPAPTVTAGCGAWLAAQPLRDKRIMDRDFVHRARPDQQGVRGVGRAKIGMAAALHDQAQILLAGEIDRGDDVFGLARRHRIDARLRGPRIEPAAGLGQRGAVADEIWVLQLFEESAARIAVGVGPTGVKRRFHGNELTLHSLSQPLPLGGRGPFGIARADAGRGADGRGCGSFRTCRRK
jgi:hypothetical protein